jgi:hypothetical protein
MKNKIPDVSQFPSRVTREWKKSSKKCTSCGKKGKYGAFLKSGINPSDITKMSAIHLNQPQTFSQEVTEFVHEEGDALR